jgi:hypothetical protein
MGPDPGLLEPGRRRIAAREFDNRLQISYSFTLIVSLPLIREFKVPYRFR